MKRSRHTRLLPGALLALGLLAWAGCGGSLHLYPLNPSPAYHCITLMLGSQQATLNYGRMDINPDEPTLALSPAKNSMRIDGESAPEFSHEQDIAVSIYGWLSVYTPGSYIGSYNGSVGWSTIYLEIWVNGASYPYVTQSGGVTITSFDSVGGDIDGNVDAMFVAQASPSPTFGRQFRAIGSFRLLRVADAFYF